MRPCLLAVVLLAAAVAGAQQQMSPKVEKLIATIAADPRLDDVEKYADALTPMAALKTDVMQSGRLAHLNYLYGWTLTADGNWPVERINDVIFEIVMSPKYRQDTFLRALETGAPFLRALRSRSCLGAFEKRYGLSLPPSGGLAFAQAETFLYTIVAAPGFDPDRVLRELCGEAGPAAATPEIPKSKAGDTVPPATLAGAVAPASVASRTQARTIILGGGVLVLLTIAMLLRSIARDRKARR